MQANKFKIPRLGFINKLDRQGSGFQTTVDSIKRRLKVEPMLINIPSGETNQLRGIIDLPSFMHIEYLDDKGKRVNIEKIDKGHAFFERACNYRLKLIEQLANYDEEIGDCFLQGVEPDEMDQDVIDRAIRRALESQKAVPLFCGSALKNKGIQPLLDAIVKYLPSPEKIEAIGIDNLT